MSDPGDEPPGGRADGPPTPGEEVGSVGDEAAKLLGALSDLARDQGRSTVADWGQLAAQAGHSVRDALGEVDEHLATGAAECRYCPICRVVHAFRETAGPEVRAHLAVAASSLMQAAAQLLEPPASATGEERAHDVEHIDLDGYPDDERPDEESTP